jgi:hypothetical protein
MYTATYKSFPTKMSCIGVPTDGVDAVPEDTRIYLEEIEDHYGVEEETKRMSRKVWHVLL